MNEELIYDFEGIVETSATNIMGGMGFQVFDTTDLPTHKKPRPRFEVKYIHGSGLSRFIPIVNGQNAQANPAAAVGLTPAQLFYLRRESAWAFTVKFALITMRDPVLHAAWRVKFRAAVAQFWVLANGTAPMTRHAITMTRDGGNSEPMFAEKEGLMRTDFLFEGNISVNADAWAVLADNDYSQQQT